jgi:hypothetical protein
VCKGLAAQQGPVALAALETLTALLKLKPFVPDVVKLDVFGECSKYCRVFAAKWLSSICWDNQHLELNCTAQVMEMTSADSAVSDPASLK